MLFRTLVQMPAISIVLALCAAARPANGQTTFNGGNVFSASSWSNGLPSVGNNGTVATNGTMNGVFNFSQTTTGTVTVTITGGTLTASAANFYNEPVNTAPGWSTFTWVQTGGTIDTVNTTFATNLRTSYTLAGGSMLSTGPNSQITTYHTGTFHQTGGTISGLGYAFTDNSTAPKSHSFTGGSGDNSFRFLVSLGNTVTIDGQYQLSFRPVTPTSEIGTSLSTGIINFQDTWTGSWTRDNFTVADWQTIFTKTGMLYEGTQITAANFVTIFEVTNPGTVGSTIRFVPVPEPASMLAACAIAAGGIVVRQLRRGRHDPRRRNDQDRTQPR